MLIDEDVEVSRVEVIGVMVTTKDGEERLIMDSMIRETLKS